MTASKDKDKPTAVAITSEAVLAGYRDLMFTIPEGAESDGTEIIAQVLQAGNWEDLNMGDKLPSSKDLAGRGPVVIESVKRQVSEYEDSKTGYYLRCVGHWRDSKKPITFTSGGDQVTAVIAMLHHMDNFPAVVAFESKQTKGGREAINAKVLAASPAG